MRDPHVRPIWKGSISFGLVSIPVRLYAATGRKDPKFNYLHAECGTPVRYLKWCPHCGKEVPPQEIALGFEFEKDRYVLLEDEDLEALPAAATRNIAILDFVDMADIDPVFFDRAYYLEPADGAARPYALLRRAMLDSGKVGVARVAIRAKETLAAVRVYGPALLMETMFWPDEVRDVSALELEARIEPDARELEMATTLIGMLSTDFDPSRYRSERRDRLFEMIRAKIEGREVAAPPPEPSKVVDLMEALKRSIAAAGGGRGPEAANA